MSTLNNYSFQTRFFVDDKPVAMIQECMVIAASTPKIAALDALDLAIEPRREKLRELKAPKTVIEAYSRQNISQEMEEASKGTWVYKIFGIPGDYYEARCLDIVDADMNPGREES